MGDFEIGNTKYTLNDAGLGLFLFVIEGEIEVLEQNMQTRDAIGIKNEKNLEIKVLQPAKLLAIEVGFV
jgi:redox-sensitive bicupin YhaK (pirin superfamily)